MDHEILKEMEKALGETKALEKLKLSDFEYDDEMMLPDDDEMMLPDDDEMMLPDDDEMMLPDDDDVTLHKEFCRHLVCGIGRNTSLSEVCLKFEPNNWDCPGVGRLVYVSHMLCDSVGCSV